MGKQLRLFLVSAFLAVVGMALAAEELSAGTQVLAQKKNDVKFYPAVVVRKALDGYTVRFEDDTEEDVLQSDMAFFAPPDAAKLAVDVKVAAMAYGDYYPGRIFEPGEDGSYVVAWDDSGADPVKLADIRIRMAAREDPRPKPPVPPPAPAPVASAPSPQPAAPATAGTPAKTPAEAPAGAPPPGGGPAPAGGDDYGAALGGILGMAGDHYPMKYSLLAPTKSPTLSARTDTVDITLDIPPDYVPAGLDFKIRNRTARTILVDWSKCYVTSFAGVKRAVYHNDYPTLEAMPAVEKASEVPAGSEQTFSLFAREGVVTTFHPAHWDGPNWIEKYNEILNIWLFFGPDLPNALSSGYTADEKARDLELRRKNVVGKSFKVGIAVVSGGATNIVELTVRIESLEAAHEGNLLDTIGH